MEKISFHEKAWYCTDYRSWRHVMLSSTKWNDDNTHLIIFHDYFLHRHPKLIPVHNNDLFFFSVFWFTMYHIRIDLRASPAHHISSSPSHGFLFESITIIISQCFCSRRSLRRIHSKENCNITRINDPSEFVFLAWRIWIFTTSTIFFFFCISFFSRDTAVSSQESDCKSVIAPKNHVRYDMDDLTWSFVVGIRILSRINHHLKVSENIVWFFQFVVIRFVSLSRQRRLDYQISVISKKNEWGH